MSPCDEVRPCPGNLVKTPKVLVSAIHDVKAIGFEIDQVENVQIMDFPRSYMDKTGYRVLQIELDVEFDGRFCPSKMSPGVHIQAQVDDRRINGKDRSFEINGSVKSFV